MHIYIIRYRDYGRFMATNNVHYMLLKMMTIIKKLKQWFSLETRKTRGGASHLIRPDGLTPRQVVSALMPELEILRAKGCSFRQITEWLVTAELDLKESTVRYYFSENLAERNEQGALKPL